MSNSPGWWSPLTIGRAGAILLLLVFFCYAVPVAAFICGQPLQPWMLPIAVLLSLVFGLPWKGFNSMTVHRWKDIAPLRPVILAYGFFTAIYVLTLVLLDFSADGVTYHQEIIYQLMRGWNPYHAPLDLPDPPMHDYDYFAVVVHYTAAMETAAATVADFANNILPGRTVNFCMAAGMACITFRFASQRIFRSEPKARRNALLLTLTVASNPVMLGQLLTYYNDFTSYCLTVTALIIASEISFRTPSSPVPHHSSLIPGTSPRTPSSLWWALGATVIFAAGTKFTTFFYVGLALIFAFAIWTVRKRYRLAFTLAGVALISALAGTILFGYHPYVTNCITAGSPLYPLYGGAWTLDIMTGNTPEIFRHSDRFTNFFISLFSINKPGHEIRIGGLGPLMGLIFICSLILLLAKHPNTDKNRTLYCRYAALCIFLGCFIFEQSWWARYIPFLWLLPVCAILMPVEPAKKWYRYLRTSLIILCIADGALFGLQGFNLSIRDTIIYTKTVRASKREYINRALPVTGVTYNNSDAFLMRCSGITLTPPREAADTLGKRWVYLHPDLPPEWNTRVWLPN